MSTKRAFFLLVGVTAAAACGESADDRSTGVSSGAATSSSATGAGGASSSATTSSATGAGGDGCPEPEATSGAGGAAEDCAAIGAKTCFSSYECGSSERCENVGTSDAPVPCCVPGPRGDGKAGAPCAGEFQCASSLCIEGIGDCFGSCTDRCTKDEECPKTMPNCIVIGFSGTDDKFCSP
jgi:hypothetical protein